MRHRITAAVAAAALAVTMPAAPAEARTRTVVLKSHKVTPKSGSVVYVWYIQKSGGSRFAYARLSPAPGWTAQHVEMVIACGSRESTWARYSGRTRVMAAPVPVDLRCPVIVRGVFKKKRGVLNRYDQGMTAVVPPRR